MTALDKMTNDEIWEEVEECFYGMYKDAVNRCYTKHSMTGIRHLQLLVRRNLIRIDRALLEIEARAKPTRTGDEG